MKIEELLKNIPTIKLIQHIKGSEGNALTKLLSSTSSDTFTGMVPILNSVVLQSDRFQKSQHKNFILFCMVAINNIIFSTIVSFVFSSILSVMCGKFIGKIAKEITSATILALTSMFFVARYFSHKMHEMDKAGTGSTTLSDTEEIQPMMKSSLCKAINDLSLIHGVAFILIPCSIGKISEHLVACVREAISFSKSDFVISNDDDNNYISTKITNIIIPSAKEASTSAKS